MLSQSRKCTNNGLLFMDTRGRMRGIAGSPSGYIRMAYLDWFETQGYQINKTKCFLAFGY